MHHLHHRRQAVGGARRSGHDAVAARLVERVVHAHHDVEHATRLHRRGNDHALGAAIQVALDGFGREELAGAFQHQVHAEIAPRNVARCGMRRERHAVLVDADAVFALGRDVGAPFALHAVKRQQVRRRGGTAFQLVEVHHLQPVAGARIGGFSFGRAEGGAQGQAADAAHAVDANFHAGISFQDWLKC